MTLSEQMECTRQSWNQATRNHNHHKGDQAAFFRQGGDVLFPEELDLLGDLSGPSLVHLQCNAGQDTLGLARRGAVATGVDFSDEAIRSARALSAQSGIHATFIEAEIIAWTHSTEARFDLAFASYGVIGWHQDAGAFLRGAARVLKPGGSLVYVEFHPMIWTYGPKLDLVGDDYFYHGPYIQPVGDYVAESDGALWPIANSSEPATLPNDIPAYSYQYTLAEIVQACMDAGLRLTVLREYAHSNGFRPSPLLVKGEGRRWVWPEARPRLPLMFGLRATKDAAP
jgi:SAM-dependent methyltransferase